MEIKQHTSEQPIGQRGNKMEIKNLETNGNKNTTYQNLWDAAKHLKEVHFFTAINVYIKKERINLR